MAAPDLAAKSKRKEIIMVRKDDYPIISRRKPDGLKADGSAYRILVADDSMFVTKQISQILASEGFKIVATAANGEEAVDVYKCLHPKVDLVTMDVTMPILDGVSALEQIVAFDKDAVVVMVTAIGRQDLVKKALLLGAKSYIVKPLNRVRVLEHILASLREPAATTCRTDKDLAAPSPA
jgi:two-component system chemotaxis response regulator CheY